ncbi:ATP-binding protein [Streptomyces sp. NPDC019443]|uniref:ATP-binding protein n=1 Tax=Streptomyces sp. NPDC019443 TaxID=3365061 RepID=UPI00379F5BCE
MGAADAGAMVFGPLLKALRHSGNWTQEMLAERSGVSVRTISDLERGRIRRPQQRSAVALAAALGVAGGDREEFLRVARSGPRLVVPVRAVEPPGTPLSDRPAQLPRLPAGLVGRNQEMAALAEATVVGTGRVCAVIGPAGVGKTSLILRWAHHAAAEFPDGQLFADLRGFAEAEPLEPGVVLRGFLATLGLPHQAVPEDEAAAQALYRSTLARRRILVVLDNAHSSEQVRPLLPGSDTSAVVVTSRNRLQGLVARDGARAVVLDMLDRRESLLLLTAVLGRERMAGASEAAGQLADLCGGLPLALRIVAARLVAHPAWTVESLVGELADERRRLSALCAEDADVEAALGLSVRTLPPPAKAVLGLFGVHPGGDLDAAAAAAALGSTRSSAERALRQLASAHLVQERVPGRYGCHDLVRLYARQQLDRPRRAALLRLLDYYLHAAYVASRAADPSGRPCCDLPAWTPPPPVLPALPTYRDAMRWYGTEAENLTAMVDLARTLSEPRRAWRLTVLLWPLLTARHHRDWTALLAQGLTAAEELADPVARSRVLVLLGWALTESGRCEEALVRLRHAVELAEGTGDRCDQATGLVNLGLALARSGRTQEAFSHLEKAAALAREIGDERTTALALQSSARLSLELGRLDDALEQGRQALELRATAPLGLLEILLLEIVGAALCGSGRIGEGVPLLHEALARAQAERYLPGEAAVLEHLARILADTGAPARAEEYRVRARALRAGLRGTSLDLPLDNG